MGKKLKSISLVLFSICCTMGFSTRVSALTLTEDMDASEITISDGMTIDGAGKFTITGGLSITDGSSITIKNVTLDGEGTKDILLSLGNAGDVVIENVTFTHYIKTGIYADVLTGLSITGSTFDGVDTDKLKDQSYAGNPEEELIKRSPAAIDLNLGNPKDNVAQTVKLDSIEITNNTFKNLKIAEENLAESTGGAIKIKVKALTDETEIGSIIIENNEFVDNARDLVIGTDKPGTNTTQAQTGDLDILLVNNGKMIVKDNSDTEQPTETLEGNYKLNYAIDKKYELNEDLYYIVNDANIDEFEDPDTGIVNDVMADDDIKGLAFNIEGVSFAISKETFNDENLDEALESLSNVNPTTETTVEALKQYQNEGVFFMDIDGLDIFDNGIHYSASLGEELSGNLFVYFFDEENGLQLVSNSSVEDGNINLSFTKNGHYVISEADLLTSLPSDETPSEEVPEVPQTFDSLGIYAGIGIISVVGIASAVIYLKRKNA